VVGHDAYTRYVSELARYYQRSPELISYEEVTNWLYHLIRERQLSASSVNVAVNAVRFLYGITLGRNTHFSGFTVKSPRLHFSGFNIRARSATFFGVWQDALLSPPLLRLRGVLD
jgi:hypothetical protein